MLLSNVKHDILLQIGKVKATKPQTTCNYKTCNVSGYKPATNDWPLVNEEMAILDFKKNVTD